MISAPSLAKSAGEEESSNESEKIVSHLVCRQRLYRSNLFWLELPSCAKRLKTPKPRYRTSGKGCRCSCFQIERDTLYRTIHMMVPLIRNGFMIEAWGKGSLHDISAWSHAFGPYRMPPPFSRFRWEKGTVCPSSLSRKPCLAQGYSTALESFRHHGSPSRLTGMASPLSASMPFHGVT